MINQINPNLSFGKIYMFPLLQEKFYKDAKEYTGLDENKIKREVEKLIKLDMQSDEHIIKQNPNGSFEYSSKNGSISHSWNRLANTFRSFIEALQSGEHVKIYCDFVKKYKI